ncbi:MAG: diguanylate cyclase [Clostridiaceae bacterium]|nr:diguanylate cyclase [Clostridiaceae bacterium]
MKMLLSLYLIFAVILAQFFAAYFFSKGKSNYRRAFSAMVMCVSIYLFGFLMIINSNDLQEMIFWNQFQYLGLPFISVLWLLVAFLYTKATFPLKLRLEYVLFVVPVITFFVRLTNSWHHLFYTKWEVRQVFGYYFLNMERGFWYYVNITYTILCMLLTVIIYLAGYLKNKVAFTKSHFLIFLFASLLPLIGTVLVIFVFNERSIDYSALVIPISLLTIGYGILKHDFLEIRTLARETIFENNVAGMVVLGPGKRIIDYNRTAEKFFKSLDISLTNSPIEQLLGHETELLEIFKSDTNQDYSTVIDGEERFFEIDALQLGDSGDKSTKLLKSIRDVTEERRIQERLKYLATTDSLSGLNNRAQFMNLARKEFALAKMDNEALSILIMDVDNFKTINDTFGHAAGDEIIREIGNIIKTSFRKTDIPGRLGGEEFAVVLRNASLDEAEMVAEKVRNNIACRKVAYGKHVLSFTVSIGVAGVQDNRNDTSDLEDILKMADDALYKAKAKGRNCVVISRPEDI